MFQYGELPMQWSIASLKCVSKVVSKMLYVTHHIYVSPVCSCSSCSFTCPQTNQTKGRRVLKKISRRLKLKIIAAKHGVHVFWKVTGTISKPFSPTVTSYMGFPFYCPNTAVIGPNKRQKTFSQRADRPSTQPIRETGLHQHAHFNIHPFGMQPSDIYFLIFILRILSTISQNIFGHIDLFVGTNICSSDTRLERSKNY